METDTNVDEQLGLEKRVQYSRKSENKYGLPGARESLLSDSNASSGIEPDTPGDSNTTSVNSYSPTISSIDDDVKGTDDKVADLQSNESAVTAIISSKDANKVYFTDETKKDYHPDNNFTIIENPNNNEGVKFVGLDDDDSICSVDDNDEDKPDIPDGGWGWMVVLSSLIISMIADGISFSFGLLYIEFLEEFKASKSKTAWIGSLFIAVPLLSGPIMSALVDRYGCRSMS